MHKVNSPYLRIVTTMMIDETDDDDDKREYEKDYTKGCKDTKESTRLSDKYLIAVTRQHDNSTSK